MGWLLNLILYCSYVSGIPAVWIGRHSRGILWYYACASFLADMYFLISVEVLHVSAKGIVFTIFPLAEFSLIGKYYSKELLPQRLQRAVFAGIALTSVWFIIDTVEKGLKKGNWEGVAILNVPLIVFCIAGLYKVIRNIKYVNIERSPLFIFSAAFLLYASYTELLMLFAEHFRGAPLLLRKQLWSVHDFLNVVKNLAIAYVIVLQAKMERTEALRVAPAQSFFEE